MGDIVVYVTVSDPDGFDARSITAVAALDDDLRRGMYAYARGARRPVTRDEAAAAVGISRKLAAFHLDKLVAAGLLKFGFAAGPVVKVGRRPKVYEPVDEAIQVQLPVRRHEILAGILAEAVLAEGTGETARDAVLRVAGERGFAAGEEERARIRPGRLGVERALTVAEGVLRRHGFEPSRDTSTCVRLRNCPFHPLAAEAPELVCGLNQAFLAGFLTGVRAGNVEAVLVPGAAECCVELRQAR
ncbi:metalloregulator ArsR/SmtB family transcription factor [Amycolatopsis sp. BJA-103]|uniref:helix-turn-helix transcriptional regulator n=1 Tax=Amycolatopsis sp. BJA-103 TaxID=1911175 RepID=UPI000C78AC04|nr:transcriptional regulator [Amycolatopsis sp. BJA-103]AUI58540.1 transcriptional regulator [Amycolatopsis sp. BJA-103]PNE15219.1 transcriptional regulator [Amycolatopsis sp. BJA-103]